MKNGRTKRWGCGLRPSSTVPRARTYDGTAEDLYGIRGWSGGSRCRADLDRNASHLYLHGTRRLVGRTEPPRARMEVWFGRLLLGTLDPTTASFERTPATAQALQPSQGSAALCA